MRRSVIFAIDVEPDGRRIGPDDTWQGTDFAMRQLAGLRKGFEELTRATVHFNWFLRLDPQIERTWGRPDWLVQACPNLIPVIRRHGDLAGIHVHAWRWDERRGCWFNDFALPWRRHCLARSAETFQSVFGTPPAASRFGDRSIWHEDIGALEGHGIRYDLTVEPGVPSHPLSSDPLASATLPDFRQAPRVPYRPSAEDYLRPSANRTGTGLWMVPISMTTRLHWHPLRRRPFLVRSALPMNLVLRPRQVWAQIATQIVRETAAPLVLILRSGDLAQPRFLANFRFVTERMRAHPGIRDCRFLTVDRAVEEYAQTRR
jgi:hypothetical protein